MQQWTRLKDDGGDLDLNFALVTDAEPLRLDAVVRCLDSAERRFYRASLESRVSGDVMTIGRTQMSILEMNKVCKFYGEGAARGDALVDVDLSVDSGVLVAVMGPSGSGKSTLLTIA